MRTPIAFAVGFAGGWAGGWAGNSAPAPLPNLLDFELDAFTSSNDQWITQRNPLALIAVVSGGSMNTSRGGWSFPSQAGVQYNVEWDYSPIGVFVFSGGTPVRVTTSDSFQKTGVVYNAPEQFSGSATFTGTGGVLWVGPALVCPPGAGLVINTLRVFA